MTKKLSTFTNEDFFNFNFKQSRKSGKGVTQEVIRSTADVIVAIDGSGDFEELQEAINEISSTGGYIQVKEGTYNLKSTINLANNIRIEGVGENTVFTTNDTIGTMFYSNNNRDITIENLTLDGNNISNITGLKLDRFSITIRNCLIINCNVGIYSTISRGLRVTNNKFEENTTSISVNGLGNDGLISDNGFFYDSGSEGIGINIGEFDFVQALLISSNVIYYRNAIKITSGELSSISNNLIENGDILINDQNNLISSNHIADHLTINGNKNLISSNFIYGFRDITINGNENSIYLNEIRAGSIIDNGTNNKIITAENSINNWQKSNSDLYYNNGNVGIGTTSPNNKLQVAGLIEFNDTNSTTLLGSEAGANMDTTSNLYNTAIGYRALYSNTSGVNNIAIGNRALQSNTTGQKNAANGNFALYSNTTGVNNIGMGNYALFSNTTGVNNIAIGALTLRNNTTGNKNTANATLTLYDLDGGDKNTALGYNTGRGLTTGSANTILGAQVTGLPAALSNNIIIADGDGNQRIRINSNGNVGIGKISPSERLNVNGNIYIENGDLIMDSPTKKWKIEIDDNGNIITTQI